jgi:hypothetical protein
MFAFLLAYASKVFGVYNIPPQCSTAGTMLTALLKFNLLLHIQKAPSCICRDTNEQMHYNAIFL